MPKLHYTYIPTMQPRISPEAAMRINRIADISNYLREFAQNRGLRRVSEYLHDDIDFIIDDLVRHGYMQRNKDTDATLY